MPFLHSNLGINSYLIELTLNISKYLIIRYFLFDGYLIDKNEHQFLLSKTLLENSENLIETQ